MSCAARVPKCGTVLCSAANRPRWIGLGALGNFELRPDWRRTALVNTALAKVSGARCIYLASVESNITVVCSASQLGSSSPFLTIMKYSFGRVYYIFTALVLLT